MLIFQLDAITVYGVVYKQQMCKFANYMFIVQCDDPLHFAFLLDCLCGRSHL